MLGESSQTYFLLDGLKDFHDEQLIFDVADERAPVPELASDVVVVLIILVDQYLDVLVIETHGILDPSNFRLELLNYYRLTERVIEHVESVGSTVVPVDPGLLLALLDSGGLWHLKTLKDVRVEHLVQFSTMESILLICKSHIFHWRFFDLFR